MLGTHWSRSRLAHHQLWLPFFLPSRAGETETAETGQRAHVRKRQASPASDQCSTSPLVFVSHPLFRPLFSIVLPTLPTPGISLPWWSCILPHPATHSTHSPLPVRPASPPSKEVDRIRSDHRSTCWIQCVHSCTVRTE